MPLRDQTVAVSGAPRRILGRDGPLSRRNRVEGERGTLSRCCHFIRFGGQRAADFGGWPHPEARDRVGSRSVRSSKSSQLRVPAPPFTTRLPNAAAHPRAVAAIRRRRFRPPARRTNQRCPPKL